MFVFFYKIRGKKRPETNYKTLFYVGLVWMMFGLPNGLIFGEDTFFGGYAFFIMGLVFMGVGLANKGKWKDEKKWSGLSEEQKKLKIAVVAGLVLLLLLGVLAYFVFDGRI